MPRTPDELARKIAELRQLAAASRRRLVEIASGLERLRREVREVGALLGQPPPVDTGDEAEREFEEVQPTGIVQRHGA